MSKFEFQKKVSMALYYDDKVRGLPQEKGSPVLHPRALHFFMSLHPEGKNALHPKRHFIHNGTTSPNALRPEWHFILSALHPKCHSGRSA